MNQYERRLQKLLSERQFEAIEKLIDSSSRDLRDQMNTELRSELKLDQILSRVVKVKKMSPTDEQLQRLWQIVEVAQKKVESLMPTVRLRYVDDSAEELDGKVFDEAAKRSTDAGAVPATSTNGGETVSTSIVDTVEDR